MAAPLRFTQQNSNEKSQAHHAPGTKSEGGQALLLRALQQANAFTQQNPSFEEQAVIAISGRKII